MGRYGNYRGEAIAPTGFRKKIHCHTAQNSWIRKLRVFVGPEIAKLPQLTQIRALQEKSTNIP
ncbi:hypothetical protein QUA32_04000 [Microcoleus sp. Pol14D6]|uniref:hypothetical protein n=1 Tax=unclassified Microcoleus TaxID=2642155 RepID=UPI002FD05163